MLSRFLIKAAVAYFVLAVGMGLYMGIRQDFRLAHVHAHFALLGWVSLALVALVYRAFPTLERSRLALAHCWLHNLGLPLFMGAIGYARQTGDHVMAPVAAGATTLALGVLMFAWNVFSGLRAADRAARSVPTSPELA